MRAPIDAAARRAGGPPAPGARRAGASARHPRSVSASTRGRMTAPLRRPTPRPGTWGREPGRAGQEREQCPGVGPASTAGPAQVERRTAPPAPRRSARHRCPQPPRRGGGEAARTLRAEHPQGRAYPRSRPGNPPAGRHRPVLADTPGAGSSWGGLGAGTLCRSPAHVPPRARPRAPGPATRVTNRAERADLEGGSFRRRGAIESR